MVYEYSTTFAVLSFQVVNHICWDFMGFDVSPILFELIFFSNSRGRWGETNWL